MPVLPRGLQRFPDHILRSGSALLGLCAIVLLWSALAYTLHATRETAIRTTRNETANLARAFEAQITRSIKAVDQSLMFVRENYARDPDNFNIADWTRSAAAVTDVAIQLTLVDRDGISRASSATPNAAPVDLRDREHIRVQIDRPEDALFISKPVIGRVSHRWSIQFTRKLFNAAGQFDGVAVISLDPSYLTRLYASIDLGRQGAITLIGTDGVIRAAARDREVGHEDAAIGKAVLGVTADSELGPGKPRIGPIDVDGIRRVTSYRTLGAYPLIVGVGMGLDEALTEYRAMRQTAGILTILLTVFLAVATLAMLLHQRRHAIAREKLRESERLKAEKSMLLETTLEHMSQGIMMVDGEGRVQVCNRRVMTMLGLPASLAAKGATLRDIVQHQLREGEFGPDEELSKELLELVHSGGLTTKVSTYERKRPTGDVLEVCSVPLKQGGGLVRTYTDITVRKTIEEDLRAATVQANSATRAKSEFLATMSHEIRSPLSGLVGTLELLRSTDLVPDQEHMVELARGSALTLLAILNDILDLSKIEAGALTLSVEPVDLCGLISEISEPHAFVARAKSVMLTTKISDTVPPFIRTDRLRLGQIVTNLLSNAVKFTDRGSITLSVDTHGTDMLQIDVRDTGIGMDAQTLARLFEPFTQADGSSSRVAGGTGLGLCISRRLSQMLDGTLTVVSEPGAGSCFTFLMRCNLELNVAAPSRSSPAPALNDALAGLRILVVDDNPTNQWLTRRLLLTLGAQAEAVSSGQEALDALTCTVFDMIVTDCHMPAMDGTEMTIAIRQSGARWSAIPIIGLTADVTPAQARRCHEAGMQDVLYKPVRRDRLAQTLGQITLCSTPDDIDQQAVFDPSSFHDLFEPNDPEGADWLRAYCKSTTAQLRDLRHLADDPDQHGLTALAHQMVGAALSVGTQRLASVLRRLERVSAGGSAAEIEPLVRLAEAEARDAITAIAVFVGENEAALV